MSACSGATAGATASARLLVLRSPHPCPITGISSQVLQHRHADGPVRVQPMRQQQFLQRPACCSAACGLWSLPRTAPRRQQRTVTAAAAAAGAAQPDPDAEKQATPDVDSQAALVQRLMGGFMAVLLIGLAGTLLLRMNRFQFFIASVRQARSLPRVVLAAVKSMCLLMNYVRAQRPRQLRIGVFQQTRPFRLTLQSSDGQRSVRCRTVPVRLQGLMGGGGGAAAAAAALVLSPGLRRRLLAGARRGSIVTAATAAAADTAAADDGPGSERHGATP